MKKLLSTLLLCFLAFSCSEPAKKATSSSQNQAVPELVNMSVQVLHDKIKGGWAGQVIGCTYGGPTEFRFNGTMINDRIPIPWDDQQMLWWYDNSPGLYDDVYMDLTFVEVFEKYGIDAPDSLHALAFANAPYPLWHANQAARYNILQGMMPPASGYWKNNPHADDIDFQIEADFAGLMAPGMPRAASAIADRIGHIMNYGDGVYGGVYVASLYALAFVMNDIEAIVREALKSVPAESEFYQCIHDVITWYEAYPDDWKRNWFEVEKKWSFEKGCPDGVFRPFNIDAKINAAYIVIGLLYGKGDYGKTIDISTRCGQDSDCNPANAAGILGTMIGYSNIPAYWKQGLDKVEDRDFPFMATSLNKVYEIGLKHAQEMIVRNGGNVKGEMVEIICQTPEPVQLEVAFEGIYPKEARDLQGSKHRLTPQQATYTTTFEGCGFVVAGMPGRERGLPDFQVPVKVLVNGKEIETALLTTDHRTRRHEVTWHYDLPEGTHTLQLEANRLKEGQFIQLSRFITYSQNDPGLKTY